MNRGDWNLYPNMFTILVGHQGLGKGRSINPAVGILRESGCANILSDKLTIQYILEKISDRGQSVAQINMQGNTLTLGMDSTCFISAPELEDFMSTSDTLPPLKELWESKDGPYEYGTRGRGLVKIAKPCPTMLGGCTPSQIALLFPSQVVGGGFIRRCNFVYEGDQSKFVAWPPERSAADPVKQKLIDDLRLIGQLGGRFSFDPVASKQFKDFCATIGSDEFADEASAGYETSKPIHVLKLAMALTVARSDAMIISFVDMMQAIQMVNKCADDLKKVFRAVGDSEMATVIDKVIRFIEAKSKLSYVTRPDLMGALWRDVGSNQNLDIILATLEAGSIIRTESRSGITIYKLVIKSPKGQGATI